ncbi:porin [Vibrio cholerae]
MKKTLVALAVLAAGSAQAGIEVYNQDGVTVNLKGDIEVVYVKGTAKDSEFTQEIQDADFGFDVRYAVNDEVSFGGYWEFDGASSDVTAGNDSIAKVGDAYVAFYTQSYGSIKFGRTCGALDDSGVGSDFQFGVTAFVDDSNFCGDEMVRYDFDNGSFYATAAFAQDKKNVGALGEDGSYFDGKLGYRVADFDFTAYYGTADMDASNSDQDLLGLEARFGGVENLNLELGYYTLETKAAGVKTVDTDVIALAADYTIDAVTLAVGYDIVDPASGDKVNNWFVNAGYGFAPNTTAYVEVGGNDEDNSETGVAVGVKASF